MTTPMAPTNATNSAAVLAMLGTLAPAKVLDEYDGPRLFTAETPTGQLLLAYSLGDADGGPRWLVVPTDARTIAALDDGSLALYLALSQPWSWIVATDHDGNAISARAVAFDTLPTKMLPHPCATLYPGLAVRGTL